MGKYKIFIFTFNYQQMFFYSPDIDEEEKVYSMFLEVLEKLEESTKMRFSLIEEQGTDGRNKIFFKKMIPTALLDIALEIILENDWEPLNYHKNPPEGYTGGERGIFFRKEVMNIE